jgi:hypothetical protein
MSLSAFQELVVALATRRSLRRRFGSDRESVLAERELEGPERRALLALSLSEIEDYAQALIAKRWTDIERAVPLTLRVCPTLGRLYRRWALDRPPSVSDTALSPGLTEALRALEPLRQLLWDGEHAPYAADLLAYEVLAACARADGTVRTLTSRYALHEIAAELRGRTIPIDPETRPTALCFDRNGVHWRPA